MKIVIALGGNAILRQNEKGDVADQIRNCQNTAKHIVDLVANDHKVVVTHGNGPQVGNLLRRVEAARDILYPLPIDICGALSQGGIGYLMQREINNVFKSRGMENIAYTIITQSLVDENDPAFQNPTKPVGSFFLREQIEPMIARGWDMIEDANRGWRRVVPSPRPIEILEERIIQHLSECDDVPVCCGGGGIPVIKKDGVLLGVEGVIDKDRATSLLSRHIDADLLIIATGVEKVAIGFNTSKQKWLDRLTVEEAKKYCEDREFPAGSMGPKIEAAIDFIEATGNDVIITLPEKMLESIEGKAGTRIVK